jgi:hypothetical protein
MDLGTMQAKAKAGGYAEAKGGTGALLADFGHLLKSCEEYNTAPESAWAVGHARVVHQLGTELCTELREHLTAAAAPAAEKAAAAATSATAGGLYGAGSQLGVAARNGGVNLKPAEMPTCISTASAAGCPTAGLDSMRLLFEQDRSKYGPLHTAASITS